jgi:hypothetical protein
LLHRPNIAVAAVVVAAAALISHPTPAQALVAVQTTDLNGKLVSIPAGLTASRSIILVGFRHDDRKQMDAWRQGLGLTDGGGSWFEMPIIGVQSGAIQTMIRRGMSDRLTVPAKSHLAPVFGDARALATTLGVDQAVVTVLVVDRSGRELARATGPFAPGKAADLLKSFRSTE